MEILCYCRNWNVTVVEKKKKKYSINMITHFSHLRIQKMKKHDGRFAFVGQRKINPDGVIFIQI